MPKISGLPPATSVTTADTIPVVQSGTTKIATMAMVGTLLTGRLIGVQVISVTGTYTPTAGTTSVVVELLGGGGAGGGAAATGVGEQAAGAGGSGGGYARSRLTTGFSGVTVTVGAGGVASAGATGGTGGTTSFGAVFSATGGTGGTFGANVAVATATFRAPSIGGGGIGGNLFNTSGEVGGMGLYLASASLGGQGGSSAFGGGGNAAQNATGVSSPSFGAGGGGANSAPSTAARVGGTGGAGVCVVWEYN